MPIRSDLRKHYGPEWLTVTRPAIMERAEHRCENCRKPHGARIETITDNTAATPFMVWRIVHPSTMTVCELVGSWIGQDGKYANAEMIEAKLDDGRFKVRTVKRVLIGVAHLNHVAGDDRPENLKAFCAWCHLIYDREHHAETRATRKDQSRPLLVALAS